MLLLKAKLSTAPDNERQQLRLRPRFDRPGRTGLLFDPADVSGLAQLMVQVSADGFDRQAMGAAAQARIGHWGLERFAEGMLAAVNYVLKKRN